MNLRIPDATGLVSFLHRVARSTGSHQFSVTGLDVVETDGVLFFVGDEPVEVGGPFKSLEALVRSEALRVRTEPREPPYRVEVFEWRGAWFRVEGGEVVRFESLSEAVDGVARAP
jgi:hypothetical protein